MLWTIELPLELLQHSVPVDPPIRWTGFVDDPSFVLLYDASFNKYTRGGIATKRDSLAR